MIQDYLTGSSPYDNCQIVTYEGSDQDPKDITLEPILPFSITLSGDIHTVLEGETLHNIAYGLWGDSGLWYLLALANDISNPFEELKPGQTLQIPLRVNDNG